MTNEISNFNTLIKFIIVNKNTDKILFGDRLFDKVGHAKNAFRQHTKSVNNRYYGEKFDEQEDYIIVKLEFELKGVSEVGGDKNLRRYIRV
mgnify:CR=1 FL=1